MVAVRRAAGGVDAPCAARFAAAGLRAGLRGDRAACRPAGRFDREAGGPGRRGHRRLPQRHARQCRGADHRPGRPARGHARRREGVAGRLDHRQPDAGPGRGLPGRRAQAFRPDLRHHRRAHPGRHAGARRHGDPGAVGLRGGRGRQVCRPVGDVQRRGVGDPAGGLRARPGVHAGHARQAVPRRGGNARARARRTARPGRLP